MNREDNVQSFAVGDECVVVIETSSGDAQVEGWSEARVEVESSGRDARVEQEGATLRIHPRPTGSGDVKVRAPQHSDVVLRSVSGDVQVRNLEGDLNVQSTSGDVKISRLRGQLKAHTVSGDLKVRRSRLSGAQIDTVSGDMELETTLDPQGQYEVRGVSGDLKLWLPAGTKCTVYSTSLSGHFDSDLPHEIVEQSRRNLEVRINGGGPAFHVRSTSGDISVRALKEPEAEEEPVISLAAAPHAQAEEPFAEQARPEPIAAVHETKPLPSQPPAAPEPFIVEEQRVPRAGTEGASQEPAVESAASRRMQILKDIEEGRISVSDGLAKLRALD